MTTGFEVYKKYLAIKRHFSSDYDYFKYNGHVNVKRETFDKRKDKYFFEKLAKKSDVDEILIANLKNNPNSWIKDLTDDNAIAIMQEWKRRKENFTYLFSKDIEQLKDNFNENFLIKENSHPYVLQLYFQEKLVLETLVALIDVTDTIGYLNSKLNDDDLWIETRHKMAKLYPFLNYDRGKIKRAILKKFST